LSVVPILVGLLRARAETRRGAPEGAPHTTTKS
jgi:hypothetical protein